MANGVRSPEMIKQSIEETRQELAFSVNDLRSKVNDLADWRGHLRRSDMAARYDVIVVGSGYGGGVAASFSIITGR